MSDHRHPKALIWLTISYSLFVAGFWGILSSLVLFQTNTLKMSADSAYGIFSAALALLWVYPLGGGYLSEKLGYANAARFGLIVGAIGMTVFCFQSFTTFYLGLALFVVGNAFATPAIWCMVDHCYSKTSHLREAGFTLFYLFFNLGAVTGIFFGGYLAQEWGFAWEFGTYAIFSLIAFLILQIAKDKIVQHPGRTIAPQVNWSTPSILGCLILFSVIATPITILLFRNVMVNNILNVILLLFVTVVILRISFKQKEKLSRNKLLAFLFLSWISIAFWALYDLAPSFLSVFIQNNVNADFIGLHIPPSSFFAFDAVFVILIGLILSRVWLRLSRKNKNPALSMKFASSLVIIGLAFCFLAMMTHLMKDQPMPARYVLCTYALIALAELLISPLGIAMVGSLSPEGQEGLMMGFWQLCLGVGSVVAGYVAMAPNLPSHAEPLKTSNPIYFTVFISVGLAGILAGCVVFLFAKKLKRLMIEHH